MRTHNDTPFASAQYLEDPSGKHEETFTVLQARIADDGESRNEPTIAVPASEVTVDSELTPNQDLKPSSPSKDMHPAIIAFKERRKVNQKIALATGFVAGCIICGPILGVIGAGVAHTIVKKTGRAKQARMENNLQSKENVPVMAVQSASLQK